MPNSKIILSVVLSVVLSITCNSGCCKKAEGHKYIEVVNNSDRDIYVEAGLQYPDTLCESFYVTYEDAGHKVLAKSSASCLGFSWSDTWEGRFERISSDTLVIFFIDADSLTAFCTDEKTDWSKIDDRMMPSLNEKLVMKRKYYTLDDLNNQNWRIVYP